MTIAGACLSFVQEELRFRNLAQGTIEGYETVFRALLSWADRIGLSVVKDLDDMEVRAWIRTWTCQPSTTRQRLAQLKKFFRFTVERGWATRSPLAPSGHRRATRHRQRPLTVPEIRALLGASEQQPKERGLILLMRYSGLAIGDAAHWAVRRLSGRN